MSGAETVTDDVIADHESDCRPQVVLPSAGPPVWVMGLGALALGIAVLLTLNGRREAGVDRSMALYGATVPPLPRSLDRAPGEALDAAGEPDPGTPDDSAADASPALPFARIEPFHTRPAWAVARSPRAFATAPTEPAPRSSEGVPGMSFATVPTSGAPVSPGGFGAMRVTGSTGSALVYDAAPPGVAGFGDGKSAVDGAAARASLIRNRAAVVAQGEVLAATLETPVDSTRPGPIRAIIARDVRGFDGTRVLIPRGSRLIGEYRADPQASRRRILATWSRLIRPDGVAIRIDSPVADALGGSGIPGRVDTHFFARFANATLQSALQVGINLASRAGSGAVIVSNAPQMSSALGQAIIPGADQPPTVSARAGTAVSVFVARDLDFGGVAVLR